MQATRILLVLHDMSPMSDEHHFDLTGYKMWSERAFALMKQAVYALGQRVTRAF